MTDLERAQLEVNEQYEKEVENEMNAYIDDYVSKNPLEKESEDYETE